MKKYVKNVSSIYEARGNDGERNRKTAQQQRQWALSRYLARYSSNRPRKMCLAAFQVLYSTGSLTEMLDALDSRHPPTRAMATACMDIVLEFDR